ncbi:hypothetical protein F5882DRAFT_73819 [Hyaloscypha sp. PMI_1271]|nr:hypothetical protein F5882DRAFT_73819 [Hyaloscypha sp. PMI_1271]
MIVRALKLTTANSCTVPCLFSLVPSFALSLCFFDAVFGIHLSSQSMSLFLSPVNRLTLSSSDQATLFLRRPSLSYPLVNHLSATPCISPIRYPPILDSPPGRFSGSSHFSANNRVQSRNQLGEQEIPTFYDATGLISSNSALAPNARASRFTKTFSLQSLSTSE